MLGRPRALLLAALLLAACGDDAPENSEETRTPDAATPDAGLDAGDASSVVPDAGGPLADATVADAATSDAGGDAEVDAGDAGDAGTDSGPRAFVTYADVSPIFAEYCTSCHFAGGTAPFSLDNYTDASEYGRAAYGAASARVMPPCAENDPSCGPTSDEIALLRDWMLGGFPQR